MYVAVRVYQSTVDKQHGKYQDTYLKRILCSAFSKQNLSSWTKLFNLFSFPKTREKSAASKVVLISFRTSASSPDSKNSKVLQSYTHQGMKDNFYFELGALRHQGWAFQWGTLYGWSHPRQWSTASGEGLQCYHRRHDYSHSPTINFQVSLTWMALHCGSHDTAHGTEQQEASPTCQCRSGLDSGWRTARRTVVVNVDHTGK